MADLIAALVVAVFLVKQQRVGAAFRNTDAVIVAVYRGEVADEEKILFLCFIAADKAENTAVSAPSDPPALVPSAVSDAAVSACAAASAGFSGVELLDMFALFVLFALFLSSILYLLLFSHS